MTIPAPKVDERTGPEIARDLRGLLPVYVEDWPGAGEAGDLSKALIYVFSRFGEIIVDRLNKTPEKNFLAFLDLLGISPLPLQAARAPVTFYLAPGAATHALVPAGTQVVATPGPGEQKPIVFETDKELVVLSARLESLVIKDGGHDQYTDFSAILAPPPQLPSGEAASVSNAPPASGNVSVIPHALYIPLPEYVVWPVFGQIRLKFAFESDLPAPVDPRKLQWELCVAAPAPPQMQSATASPAAGDDGITTIAVQPLHDETESLTKSGDVVFLNLPALPSLALAGVPGRWLRCRLLTRITRLPKAPTGMVREPQLPSIKTLTLDTRVSRTGLAFDQAFFNNLKLDVTKDFFPFGERPKFGDTFYLASREALSNPDAVLTVHVTVTNPASNGVDTPIPAAKPQDAKLRWEFWDGNAWAELGTSEIGARRIRIVAESADVPDSQFSDSTQVLSESGDMSFKFPKAPAPLNLNGQTNYWVRVRIVAGDYGKEAHMEHVKGNLVERELHKEGTFVFVPATFAPPSIRSITVDYEVSEESHPGAILTYNDFEYVKIDPMMIGHFKPFLPVSPDQSMAALYFGFTSAPPAGVPAPFPNMPVSIYVRMSAGVARTAYDPSFGSLTATWEYWNGKHWTKLTVLDDTHGVRRAGLIRFLAPSDFAASDQFLLRRYWLRMRQDDPEFKPAFRQVLLNTTIAVQGTTVSNEILGSSNGTPSQTFRATQAPVLADQRLEVREPTVPPREERARILAEEGNDAITRMPEPTGQGDTFWVRWREVPNFYGSGSRDRDYLLDRLTGEITFGDGTYGMVPPALPSNLRLSYRSGGGITGNKPANAITQLKTAVPYVQKASNSEAANGGTDSEPDAALLERGPRSLRHGGRAVTREDFEDLARLASREVARAKCLPLFDLTQDPDAKCAKPGVISLIVTPRSTDPKPEPSQDLFDRVRSYIDARRLLIGDLKLVGPEYVRVDVECEIAVCDPEAASEVELAAKNAIEGYLHPVTGGRNGTGWEFGEQAQRSDFFGLIEAIPGVSHVRDLRVTLVSDRPGGEKTGRFLIRGGAHRITTTLEE